MDTRAFHATTALLLLGLITAGHPLQAAGKQLRLGNCVVTVHILELEQKFTEMQQFMDKKDNHIGIQILNRKTMKELQHLESCCFLKRLLSFYLENVFMSYSTGNRSSLANSFLSIRNELDKCTRCRCGADSEALLATIYANYKKLEAQDGAVKAIGELGTLLKWMKTFGNGRK